jgi:FkbM family methyltransferase
MSAFPAQPPMALVVSTIYGPMIVNRHDINQTNALIKTGRAYDAEQIEMLALLLGFCPPDPVVVDAGANIGTFTLRLAAAAGPRGRVLAFEPQRVLAYMLAGSVVLNGLTNVTCEVMALGDRDGTIEVPQFDYDAPLNFGSIEFGGPQREPLDQQPRNDPAWREFVPLVRLDRFALPRLDLFKIDVEGMEEAVLDGARETIARHHPILFVEHMKSDEAQLLRRLGNWGYEIFRVRENFLALPPLICQQVSVTGFKIDPPPAP